MPRGKKATAVEVDTQPGIEDGFLGELIDEQEVRQRQAAIIRRLPTERKQLREATENIRKARPAAWLKIVLLQDNLLTNDEAKSAVLNLKLAIANGTAKVPSVDTQEAILNLEIGDLLLAREITKEAIRASEVDYDMLDSQMMYYASMRKNDGRPVRLGDELDQVYRGGDSQPFTPVIVPSTPDLVRDEEPVAMMIFPVPAESNTDGSFPSDPGGLMGPENVAFVAPSKAAEIESALETAHANAVAKQEAAKSEVGIPTTEVSAAATAFMAEAPAQKEPNAMPFQPAALNKPSGGVPPAPEFVLNGEPVSIGSLYGRETLTEFEARKAQPEPERQTGIDKITAEQIDLLYDLADQKQANITLISLEEYRRDIEELNIVEAAALIDKIGALPDTDVPLGPRDDENTPPFDLRESDLKVAEGEFIVDGELSSTPF